MSFSKSTYATKLTDGTQKGTGYIVYEVEPYDEKEVIKSRDKGKIHFGHCMKIHLRSKVSISSVYYEKEGKNVRNVAFDDTITCHIKTYNLIGNQLKINLYRFDRALWIDWINPDDTVNTYTVTIDSEGKASFDFCIKKEWNGWAGTRETFYIEVDDVTWYNKSIRNQGQIIGYTEKDKLHNQVNPVVVEQASGTSKKKKEDVKIVIKTLQ